MVLDENRKVSPCFICSPRYLPRASWAEAARRSPWLPVTISIRLPRATSAASSGGITGGKPFSTPTSVATLTMRCIARPRRQIERPAACPASASVFSRATFEAKVVATTIPGCAAINSVSGPASVASERPGWGEKTLVLSQARSCTPPASWAILCQSSGSKASPTTGVPSSLKSPEWTIRPAGVSMISAELSGIEWLTGTNCTRKGPALTTSGRAATLRITSRGNPASSIFSVAIAAVKARAWTGAFSRGHRCTSAPM